MVGAVITALVGAIMLLAGEFAGAYWETGYTEGWVYVGLSSGAGAALILILLASGLLFAAYIAITGLKAPPTVGRLRAGLVLATVVTISVLVCGLVFAGYAIANEWDEWWISEGGWGGLGGGLLTAMFFYLALRQARATAAPYQMAPQPMLQPYQQTPPTMVPPRGP
jgi:dipeptide/tripeptide permease